MNKVCKIFFTSLMLMYFSIASALSQENNFNNTYFGDFSNRSLIMKSLNSQNRITQEQKDILSYNKLTPTPKCLIEQIKKNNIENVRMLLDAKVDPNQQYNIEYPFYIAAKLNNMEMVELLYLYGAKPDKSLNSELYEAVKNKNEAMVQFLLDRNANVNYIDIIGNTPLYMALKNNMTEIARQMIDKGARIDNNSYILIKKKKLDSILQK